MMMFTTRLDTESLCRRTLMAIGISLYCTSVSAEAVDTHCKAEEYVFANAKMRPIDPTSSSEWALTNKSGKILSICGDTDKEPLKRLVYRFGTIGRVEMEMVASHTNKAGLSTQSDSASHTGSISIQFNKGSYTYEVSEGMGMMYGIRVFVYKSRTYLLGFQSDEYESQMSSLNFDKISSPIFKMVKPIDPW